LTREPLGISIDPAAALLFRRHFAAWAGEVASEMSFFGDAPPSSLPSALTREAADIVAAEVLRTVPRGRRELVEARPRRYGDGLVARRLLEAAWQLLESDPAAAEYTAHAADAAADWARVEGRIGDLEWEELGLRAYVLLGLADGLQQGSQAGCVLESLVELDLTGFGRVTIAETLFALAKLSASPNLPAVLLSLETLPENPTLQKLLDSWRAEAVRPRAC
jgi:hypothetical protein